MINIKILVLAGIAILAVLLATGFKLQPGVMTTIISPIPAECTAVGGDCHTGVGCGWKTAQPPAGNCVAPQEIAYTCSYDYCNAALASSSETLQSCEVTTAPTLDLQYLYVMKRGDTVTFPRAGGYLYFKVVEVEYTCPWSQPAVPEPTPPRAPLWQSILSGVLDWLRSFFSWLMPGTIVGAGTYDQGQQASFVIDMTAGIDNDYTDNTYQVQYGGWMIVDSAGTIIEQSEWERVYGSYRKTMIKTVPSAPGDYTLVAVIYNYNMQYANGQWSTVSEDIATKEAIKFTVKSPTAPAPGAVPVPSGNMFTDILAGIKSWICSTFRIFC